MGARAREQGVRVRVVGRARGVGVDQVSSIVSVRFSTRRRRGERARRREIAMDVGAAMDVGGDEPRGDTRARHLQTKTRDRLCVSGGPGHDIIGFERGGEGDAIVPAYALRAYAARRAGCSGCTISSIGTRWRPGLETVR